MSDCKHCPTRARMGYHDGIYADMVTRQPVCDDCRRYAYARMGAEG